MDNFAIYTSEKIKILRKRLSLSQEEFAKNLGLALRALTDGKMVKQSLLS